MLNPVREGEEDYIEAIRYRRRLKIFENFLFFHEKTVIFCTGGYFNFRACTFDVT